MLTNRYPHVFSPIQIGPVRLKNRLGFAPMVCNKCTVDGTVTDSMVEFVYQQASTGVGYVTIGDTQVDDDLGGAFMATLNIARKTSIPGMIKLTEAAGFGGTVLSVELNHSGRGAKDDLTNGQPIGPSAVCFPRCSQNVRPMERADLERVKGLFVHCAKQCVRAGFRMLMVHCAHNNLLGQFLSPLSNLRTDEYGGSPENRRRYPLEVLAAVRQAVGPDVAIEVRVSAEEITPGGLQFDESLAFMEQAQQYCDLLTFSAEGSLLARFHPVNTDVHHHCLIIIIIGCEDHLPIITKFWITKYFSHFFASFLMIKRYDYSQRPQVR